VVESVGCLISEPHNHSFRLSFTQRPCVFSLFNCFHKEPELVSPIDPSHNPAEPASASRQGWWAQRGHPAGSWSAMLDPGEPTHSCRDVTATSSSKIHLTAWGQHGLGALMSSPQAWEGSAEPGLCRAWLWLQRHEQAHPDSS